MRVESSTGKVQYESNVNKAKRYCPLCGAEIKENVYTCPGCGITVSKSGQSSKITNDEIRKCYQSLNNRVRAANIGIVFTAALLLYRIATDDLFTIVTAVVTVIVSIMLRVGADKALNDFATNTAVGSCVKALLDNAVYVSDKHISKEEITSSRIFGCENMSGSDLVAFTQNGMNVKLSNIQVFEEKLSPPTGSTSPSSNTEYVFKGRWIIIDTTVQTPVDFVAFPKYAEIKNTVSSGIPELDSKFLFSTQCPERLLEAITLPVIVIMLRVCDVAGDMLYMSFQGSKVHIAINDTKQFFLSEAEKKIANNIDGVIQKVNDGVAFIKIIVGCFQN